ncbi:acetyl-CoA acetyltransferase [Sphingopyxis macrogoltabida]|uniref:Acetyl-CoA acetyltransferase n=1 Tax=Sphingopyxis macrogoltabida TaxID=33050 RepID=A0AAC8YXF0_SPHMC|nr:acetyl-CoA acetyltransferase [Sphingopyxis macrogoltabida]ALJ11844.1 acetyl-CoA acetyltransferase [Sphingopyxis macrogoltabida]AMU88030.1 acetyl-CoA acetyltransferase [Sphingopyxis macrogoltabida]
MSDENIPIIVGVGQINDRPENPVDGHSPVGLMAEALRIAEMDAGGALLADADYLGIVQQISFRDIRDARDPLAQELGIAPATMVQSEGPNGDSPVMLLNEAANRIGAGESRIALVCGAEALRTAAARAAAQESGRRIDATREAAQRREPSYAQQYGLVAPVDVYPLYENALRASLGQSFAEAQAESGMIWSLFSEVAAANPNAWLRKPVSADEVIAPSESNRPIAFPYNKLMVANASVNQGAAFIVTSVAEARRRGIAEDRWIYVGNGAAAHEPNSPLQRDRYDHSASMEVSIRRTLALNDVDPSGLDIVELYSCFPCIPKLARRIIDWPAERPATVFGGLTFGGGPIGNYMGHAIASMTDRLRVDGGTGLLFANGGYATHNHSIVISSEPITAASFPRSYDYQEEADAMRDAIPALARDYLGDATIESYTILYRRDGLPKAGVVVARTPAGERTLAHVPPGDEAVLRRLADAEADPVGATGRIVEGAALREWRFA